jgi:hypothetical protein
MESKYGRVTIAKIELDVPLLKEFKDHLQKMADHFKQEAEEVDLMIVTLEKRVTVLREEDRLNNDRRQRDEKEEKQEKEDRSKEHPFRGSVPPPTTPYPYPSTTKPTNPDTGQGSVSPTTPPPPAGQEHQKTPGAQNPEVTPVNPETSSGVEPTTEEGSPRNRV